MGKETIAIIQSIIQHICFISMAILSLILFVVAVTRTFSKVARTNLSVLLIAVICVFYGGTKSITNRTSTDKNIDILSISLDPIKEVQEGGTVTNIIGAKFTICTTPESVLPNPIWFRDSNYSKWTNVTAVATWDTPTPILDMELTGGASNVYTWTSNDFTNHMKHAQWYVGVDLPSVQVDITDKEYIILDEVSITSKRVRFKFHLNPELEYPEGTVIEIQRSIDNRPYAVVDSLEAIPEGEYLWNGFSVGVDSKWRLHIAIVKEDE